MKIKKSGDAKRGKRRRTWPDWESALYGWEAAFSGNRTKRRSMNTSTHPPTHITIIHRAFPYLLQFILFQVAFLFALRFSSDHRTENDQSFYASSFTDSPIPPIHSLKFQFSTSRMNRFFSLFHRDYCYDLYSYCYML